MMQFNGEKLIAFTAAAALLASTSFVSMSLAQESGEAAQDSAPAGDAATATGDTAPENAAPEAADAEAAAPADASPDPAENAADPDSGAAGTGDSALGEDAGDPAAPEVLEVVRDTFADWQVRCSPEGTDCFMYQLALDTEANPVAEFSMIRLVEGNEAAAGVTVVTPLGTLLPTGLVLQVDSGEQRQYPFSWCSQVGCFARFGLAGDTVDRMKRGKVARLRIASVVSPEDPVTLDISLSGFTDAYNSLEASAPLE